MFVLNALSLMILGIAALVALPPIYRNVRTAADDPVVLIVTSVGWVLFLYGVFQVITWGGAVFDLPGVVQVVSICALLTVLVILGMTVARFRDGERRALLCSLAMAAERGLPLAPSARAFALRRCDEMARRAWVLADQLDAGVPLSVALEKSGNPLPPDATFMVGLSGEGRAIPAALRESASFGVQQDEAWRAVFQQFVYLLLIGVFTGSTTAFILVFVIPTFRAIFDDFGVQLPAVTRSMIAVGNFLALYWYLFFPVVLYIVVVLLVSAFFFVQGKVWIPPPLGMVFGRTDYSALLRGLAVCLEQRLPIDYSLQLLASHYPKMSVQRQLRRTAQNVLAGADWCDALQEEQIITSNESAVLRSAARAGNLSWALREMAELNLRRFFYRAKLILNIASPIFLVLMALPVAFFAFGCMLPLISLIMNLT